MAITYTITIDDAVDSLLVQRFGSEVNLQITNFILGVARFQEQQEYLKIAPVTIVGDSKVTVDKVIK